ncbi:MAG: metallophosphoesterase family protein [Humidesulfovibrio sp.]|uniref:metallophosphoesterase family protein n=1 Tax=Humidesulfovibrio sp. TaxID=2910988 RepID=UPI0027350E62|nr:metallophosphoesterase family protein [Humidesulfovibrio sp.]MDP2847723.1 metallophosphoesterase family protein [Humidesulfovibrio sp.]
MRLAVISDSHLSGPDERFCALYDEYLAPTDVLLHCGDMVGASLYHYLSRHKRFLCVRGNCDHFALDHELPLTLSRELELPGGGLKVGIAHGWGERSTVWKRVADTFPAHDLVCFGHTHRRHWAEHQGSWMLNPGSLAEGSLALLDVADDGTLSCTFVDI